MIELKVGDASVRLDKHGVVKVKGIVVEIEGDRGISQKGKGATIDIKKDITIKGGQVDIN